MGRRRIGKIEWYDETVWVWLSCAVVALFSLWGIIYFCEGMGVVFSAILMIPFLGSIFFVLFALIKTVLEVDTDFLYVVNIRCFIRYLKMKILMRDIVCIDFYLIPMRYGWFFPEVKVTDFQQLRKYENLRCEIIQRNGDIVIVRGKFADDVFKYLRFLKSKIESNE